LEKENFNKNLFGIADCFYGKTFNSNIKELGLHESGKQERLWPYSGQNFKLNDSYAPLLKYLSKDLNPIFNFKVTKISHQQNDKIVVFGEKNRFVTCDKLLVTVPLSILREIDFYPQLPTK
jgi:protoporphyrinogen oxidase